MDPRPSSVSIIQSEPPATVWVPACVVTASCPIHLCEVLQIIHHLCTFTSSSNVTTHQVNASIEVSFPATSILRWLHVTCKEDEEILQVYALLDFINLNASPCNIFEEAEFSTFAMIQETNRCILL